MKNKVNYAKIILRGVKMTIVFKISDNLKAKVIKYYEPLKREKTPPYAIFQAQDADTIITLYESGKIMFQGISADIDANIWLDLEKKLNNRTIDISGKEKEKKPDKNYHLNNYVTMGSDEVGTGDFFGPIIVSAAFVTKENQEFLRNLKVGDSKKITDEKIKEIAPQIMQKIPYTTFKLDNATYNENYSTTTNMNKIKAILHNKVLLSLLNKGYKPEKIVVDQFCKAQNYFAYLADVPQKVTNIFFTPKAEDQCLAVACASIISRYVFLTEMAKMAQELGSPIPKGAGNQVDEFAQKIKETKGLDYLKTIAKINFKNMQKINE